MLRVGYDAPFPQIDDQIEFFQRNLANEIGQLIGDFDDAKDSSAPRQSQLDGRAHPPLFDPIGHGPGSDAVDRPEAKLSDDLALQVKHSGTRVHQGFRVNGSWWSFASSCRDQHNVTPILNFDLFDNLAHAPRLARQPAVVEGVFRTGCG